MDGVGNVFVCVPVLEVVITRLLNRQGVDLFDIINPVVTPRDVSAAFTFFLNFVTWRCVCVCCHINSLSLSLFAAGLCGHRDGLRFPSSPPGRLPQEDATVTLGATFWF